MRLSRLTHASTCLTSLILLTHCGESASPGPENSGIASGTTNTSNPAGDGTGAQTTPGSTATGGGGNSTTSSSSTTSNNTSSTNDSSGTQTAAMGGGTAQGTAGSGNTNSGNTSSGNTSSGNTSSGNTSSSNAGSGNTSSSNAGSGNDGTMGQNNGGGGTSGNDMTMGTAGTDTGAGGMNTGMNDVPDVDQNGKANAAPGEETTVSRDYLRLGDFRILNNRWGSEERGCDTSLRVFVNQDRTIGWDINRGACGGGGAQPDFPEIEFGIHPFGIGSANETSPPFSSTELLPLPVSQLSTASVTVDNLNINLQSEQAWNISVEFWLSERDPVNDPNPGTYAEFIAFWGWQNGRWECDTSGSIQAGDRSYSLCHEVADWADGQWRYFQLRMDGGPSRNFNGRVDIKAFIDWLVNSRGYSRDLWLTRIEVGSEIDDNTGGTVTLNNITFEVNGTSKSVELSN